MVGRERDPLKTELPQRPKRLAKIAIYEGISGPEQRKLLRKKSPKRGESHIESGGCKVTFIDFFDPRYAVHRKIVIESDSEALEISNRSQI